MSRVRAMARGRARPAPSSRRHPERSVELRVPGARFAEICAYLADTSAGEHAGFLICGTARLPDRDLLLVREWFAVPEDAVVYGDDHGLSWSSSFNAKMIARAAALRGGLVLVHAHGAATHPQFSDDDEHNAAALFPVVSRLLPDRPSGSVVLGGRAACGRFWRNGLPSGPLMRLRIVQPPLDDWLPQAPGRASPSRRRLDRQTRALGRSSEGLLAQTSVAVVGVCGGGSHVCQQLAHLGVGRIIPVDDQMVEDVNLSRMVGATPADVGRTYKTAVMRRLISAIDPAITVREVRGRFQDPRALEAIKTADVVISCVDTLTVREEINAFCRRYHLPLIDIGMSIKTEEDRLAWAHGQIVIVMPDSACLRCGPLLSDEALARERAQRPPGYDQNVDAVGDPQVISMNGVLASEAANSVVDLVTGYASGGRTNGWWTYNGRSGRLVPCTPPPRREKCPACAELGHGDFVGLCATSQFARLDVRG